jgi:hypothetical protein
MSEDKKRSPVLMIAVTLLTFLACSWLLANWDSFKAGLAGGDKPPAKSQP